MAMFMYRISPATIATVAKELIHIQTGASQHLIIHSAQITAQTTLSVAFTGALAIAATTNAVGSTLTPTILNGANATCISSGFGPTASNATGLSYLDSQAVNTLTGYTFLPTPEMRPQCKPGQRIVLRIDSTHTEDFLCDAWIKFEEMY